MQTHLKTYFNFPAFRPGQEEIIQSILDGIDVVALMPTGGGKSVCFQLPALIQNTITIVISPLIALMKDQVDGLRARGISAAFINSSLTSEEMGEVMSHVASGKIRLLYVAPERLSSEQFLDMCKMIDVGFVAVDEAHCVSYWGHDFRPDYLYIKKFVAQFKKRPVVGAFTATATPEVKDDIIHHLALQNPMVFIRGFDRPNLKFFVQQDLKKHQRVEEVLRIITTLPGSGIVYTISRKETEDMAAFLNEHKISAIAYHAGLASYERTRIQNEFMDDKFKVIVATIAFGMGVDKADIRFVIHCGMPNSLEGYYQEAGRAGRDGENAYCVLLHSGRDTALHNYFIQQSKKEMSAQGKTMSEIEQICDIKYRRLEYMMQYVGASTCRRAYILSYFADPEADSTSGNCGACDACLNFSWVKATPVKKSKRHRTSDGGITGTVTQTAQLYTRGLTPAQIAKARAISERSVMGHLAAWYESGGAFDIRAFVPPLVEEQIHAAISRVGSLERLKPIKEALPEDISYEQIRFVMAGMRRKGTTFVE